MILTPATPAVKPATLGPADGWDSWTDEVTFSPVDDEPTGPSEADSQWWAENGNEDYHSDEPDDGAAWDLLAEEAAFIHSLENGYCHC